MTKRITKTGIGRVRAWCLANPGENLSISDMEVMFDITLRNAFAIVHKLRGEGLLHSHVVYLVTRPVPKPIAASAANDAAGPRAEAA